MVHGTRPWNIRQANEKTFKHKKKPPVWGLNSTTSGKSTDGRVTVENSEEFGLKH